MRGTGPGNWRLRTQADSRFKDVEKRQELRREGEYCHGKSTWLKTRRASLASKERKVNS